MNVRDTMRLTVKAIQKHLAATPNKAVLMPPDQLRALLGHVRVVRSLLRSVLQVASTGLPAPPGLWEAVRHNVPPLEDIGLPPLEPPRQRDAMEVAKAYGVELEAIEAAAVQVRRLRMTAPVDDDFPAVKRDYDRAVGALVRALVANERWDS